MVTFVRRATIRDVAALSVVRVKGGTVVKAALGVGLGVALLLGLLAVRALNTPKTTMGTCTAGPIDSQLELRETRAVKERNRAAQ